VSKKKYITSGYPKMARPGEPIVLNKKKKVVPLPALISKIVFTPEQLRQILGKEDIHIKG